MFSDLVAWLDRLAVVAAVGVLLALLFIMGRIRRQSRTIDETPGLWAGRDYRCPGCGSPMQAGWVMLGKGAIWSARDQGPPRPWSHLGQTLPNTLSLDLPPACNLAWRCPTCRLLLIDHDKLVRARRGRRASARTHSA